jgi:hypothetical protein
MAGRVGTNGMEWPEIDLDLVPEIDLDLAMTLPL